MRGPGACQLSQYHTVGDVVLEIETDKSVSLISKETVKFFVEPLRGAAQLGSISNVSQFLRSQFSVSISKTWFLRQHHLLYVDMSGTISTLYDGLIVPEHFPDV